MKLDLERRLRVRAAGLVIAAGTLAATAGAHALPYTSENRDVYAPNTGAWPTRGVSLGGTTFVNLGLQGVGRIAASAEDPVTGESFGSISDLQVGGFRQNANGSRSRTRVRRTTTSSSSATITTF